MIGTRINATLWHVHYRYREHDDSAKRLVRLASEIGDKPPAPSYRGGERFVTTADPTGDDLCAVARAAVLGAQCNAEHEFTLTHVHRVADIDGLARVGLGKRD